MHFIDVNAHLHYRASTLPSNTQWRPQAEAFRHLWLVFSQSQLPICPLSTLFASRKTPDYRLHLKRPRRTSCQGQSLQKAEVSNPIRLNPTALKMTLFSHRAFTIVDYIATTHHEPTSICYQATRSYSPLSTTDHRHHCHPLRL